MYKKMTGEDILKALNLPSGFQVDGVLLHGRKWKRKHEAEFSERTKYLGETLKLHPFQEDGFWESIKVLEIGDKKFLYDSSYGGAYTSEFVHLGCLLGSKINILLGSCGGLDKAGEAGDIVIPVSSFGNESSTRMYDPENEEHLYFSDEKLSGKLAESLTSKDHKIIRGKIITCQAAFAEDWTDIERWSEEGFSGVEMESATFFAVSKYFGVPAAALLFVADNLIKKETLFGPGARENLKETFEKAKKDIFETAIDQLISHLN
jgi:purine-nucleoside phosphorylase